MKSRLVLTILLIPLALSTEAQFRKGSDKMISVDMLNGFIHRHKEEISHLLIGHPRGFRLSFEQKTLGKEAWEQRYNYPDLGITLTYLNYQNPVLGYTIGITPYFGFYFTKNKLAKSQFRYKLGLGLGVNSKTYDPVDNNKNNVLSTTVSGAVLLELDHYYKISPRLETATSIAMTHFSNGALKKPNSGINVISANIGLRYRLANKPIEYNAKVDDTFEKQPLGYVISLTGGVHEAIKIGAGAYPFVTLSGMVDKQLNHKSRLGLGLEFFYSESLKKEIQFDTRLNGEKPNSSRVGLFISHELMVNKFSIVTQAGYYVYDPYSVFTDIYLKANLRRYFGRHLFGGFGVKSHAAKAEGGEFIIGYRL